MEKKKAGIPRDLIIHPGETIADVLRERSITQAELAEQTGMSLSYIRAVLSGKKSISEAFAKGLESAFGVPESFWMRLQERYDAELREVDGNSASGGPGSR